ncbi:hypothetical protein IAQ61_010102 [Plenodomus lingam]|uniref:uncharacterized protein n=1 Tax=Leptosphaeria maculans TaxID=5022 RepID=UPI0033319708|nr:hypothetical protein IAQ61_010102 [Plenodomus lingam]
MELMYYTVSEGSEPSNCNQVHFSAREIEEQDLFANASTSPRVVPIFESIPSVPTKAKVRSVPLEEVECAAIDTSPSLAGFLGAV